PRGSPPQFIPILHRIDRSRSARSPPRCDSTFETKPEQNKFRPILKHPWNNSYLGEPVLQFQGKSGKFVWLGCQVSALVHNFRHVVLLPLCLQDCSNCLCRTLDEFP